MTGEAGHAKLLVDRAFQQREARRSGLTMRGALIAAGIFAVLGWLFVFQVHLGSVSPDCSGPGPCVRVYRGLGAVLYLIITHLYVIGVICLAIAGIALLMALAEFPMLPWGTAALGNCPKCGQPRLRAKLTEWNGSGSGVRTTVYGTVVLCAAPGCRYHVAYGAGGMGTPIEVKVKTGSQIVWRKVETDDMKAADTPDEADTADGADSEAVAPPQVRPGERLVTSLAADAPWRLGPYQVRGCLEDSGSGQVFLGVTADRQEAAVRVFDPAALGEDGALQRLFDRENAVAQRASSRYLAPASACDANGSPPWMAAPYMPGPSLALLVASNGPLALADACKLGTALADALAALHSAGLVYCALRPISVIVGARGPQVTDFTMTRPAGASVADEGAWPIAFPFLAPEIVSGRTTSVASDVFSLGGIVCFMTSGHGPFDALTAAGYDYDEVARRISDDDPDLSGVPEKLSGLVHDCLAKSPENRPSLSEVRQRLAATRS